MKEVIHKELLFERNADKFITAVLSTGCIIRVGDCRFFFAVADGTDSAVGNALAEEIIFCCKRAAFSESAVIFVTAFAVAVSFDHNPSSGVCGQIGSDLIQF